MPVRQLGTGQLGDLDIASDLQLLACRRPALESQTGRDLALVDLAVADKVLVLAVAHKDLAEHLAVVHAATAPRPSSVKATAPWATISPISDMASPLRPRVMAPEG